jgi:putative endonuclease
MRSGDHSSLSLQESRIFIPDSFFYIGGMIYYVYILYSQSKDRYYTGYSHNPEDRVIEHNAGATPSTRPGIPWIMVYKEEFADKTAAIKRENTIKKMKSRKYIERLISDNSTG